MYKVHCTVIFAIAQLSCYFSYIVTMSWVEYSVEYYYRFSQPRDHLQWRLVLGYYD